LMLGAVSLVARSRASGSARRAGIIALLLVAVASFVASVLFTDASPAQAYFATFTRAWEFALGGLVALALQRRISSSPALGNLLATGGLIAIAMSVALYGPTTPFPGVAAVLPAAGTAAVIAAGTLSTRTAWSPLFGLRPVQWVGDASYSLYLWHWPLIVVAPFVLSREMTGPVRVGVLILALVLAGLTRRWLERPAQSARWWRTSTRRAVLGMIGGMAIVALGAAALLMGYSVRAAADSPTAPVAEGPCVGPNALMPANNCADPFGRAESVDIGARNEYFYTPPECGEFLKEMTYGDKATTHLCDFSRGAENPPNVWLIGDSHAQQWQGPIFDIARERGWKLTISFMGGCPTADVAFVGFRSAWGEADRERCRTWNRDLAQTIIADAPDLVITSMAARHDLVDDGSRRSTEEQFTEGLQRDWRSWTDAGSRILVIGDPPFNGEVRSPDCVVLNVSDPLACARPRSQAQPADPLTLAVAQLDDPAVTAFDPTPYFCDTDTCYAVVGGVPVYYDADHLNLVYARMLRPMLEAALPVLSR
ncbi:acyltransferase family protein, partial [Microbacterium sp. B24]|uniref:acyltransferase family protein n=1 Tax=Microbacterium sp. B24 TaxID=95616 RepID=UPI001650FAEE